MTLCCQTVDNSPIIWVKTSAAILNGDKEMGWNADQRKRYKILGTGKFMIINVTESDDSVYTCSYNNGNKAMYLTVQLAPDPPKVSSDKNVYKSGENATLTCTSSGKPAPTIYWMSQGRRYIGVSAINDRTTTNTLSILVSRQYNKQSFTCFVYNDVNINKPLQQNMIFDVQYPPYVRIKQRINRDLFKVIENTRMTLTCIVDANPPISNIKWIKDSKLLKDSPYVSSEKEFHYSENVSKADNGKYECSAENSLGIKNDFINVDILYYPRISVKSNITVAQKSSVILNCSADANPPATIKWIGKNNQIRNKNNFIIHNVRVGDAGKYRCEAQNNMLSSLDINRTGTAIAITTLHVKYKPGPAILRLAGTPIKGEDIVLICDLPQNAIGYPHPYFRWRKIGNNYFKESTKKLVIANATLSDSGSYTCNAQNIEGEGGTDILEVRVKEYPEFQKKLSRFLYLNVTDKSPILMCKVRGNPSPNITWYKDGHPVSRYDYIVGQSKPQPQQNSFVVTSFLNFSNFSSNSRNVRPSDTGNYSCVVTTLLNQSFVLKSNMQIIIKSSPQIKKKDEIVAIDLNDNASISIIVQVYPPPKFHWSKNNMPLPFKNIVRELGINKYQSTFIIPSATRADLGVYKCYVNNTYGFQVITRDIRETSVPDPPDNLSSVDATWESVYLSWVAGFNGGEEQTFVVSYMNSTHNHSVEVAVENTGKIYYNVTNLMPDTTYVFSVQGRNRLGKSKSSNFFSVHTIYLALPTPENVKYLVADKKIQFEVRTDYECCTRLLIAKNGENINNLVCMPTIKKWKNNSVDLPNADVESVSVGLCLKRRHDLCGNYVQAIKVEPNMSAGPLSTFHVIVIAVVCGIILIVLVVILILFLYWRSRNQKKQYGNEVNYPHMSNGSVPNGIAGRQGYDNPGMVYVNTVDGNLPMYGLNEKQESMPNGYGPYTNGFVENTHNTSSEHTDELPPYTDQDIGQELSDESDLDKPYDCRPMNDSVINELPPSYSDVCRGLPEKPGAMTFYNNPHNITRNPNFISLSPDGMPRDTSISGRESGYSTPDSTRPKKVIYEVIV